MSTEDYARHTDRPRTVHLAGQDYRVSLLSPIDYGEIQAWFKTQVPNPKAVVAELMKGQADEVAKDMWASACAEDWPPSLHSAEGRALLLSPEGVALLIWIALRKNLAGFDREAARQLAARIDAREFLAVQQAITPGETGDPKSPAGTTTDLAPATLP